LLEPASMFAKSAAPAQPKRSLRAMLRGDLVEVFALSPRAPLRSTRAWMPQQWV
jgi:hypothetical protein